MSVGSFHHWFKHYSGAVQCQQNDKLSESLMKDERWPKDAKTVDHEGWSSNVTSLPVWLILSQSLVKRLCLSLPQETETEYGNLQIKHQPAGRVVSKWVTLCVWLWIECPECTHVVPLNLTLPPYFCLKTWSVGFMSAVSGGRTDLQSCFINVGSYQRVVRILVWTSWQLKSDLCV